MTDRLRSAMATLSSKMLAHAGVSITYRRGVQSVSLTAVPGSTLLRLSDQYGSVKVERTDRDYCLNAADLVISGTAITPQRGDEIVEDDGDKIRTYKVLPYGDEPCWRWADHSQTVYRIHAKLVQTGDS